MSADSWATCPRCKAKGEIGIRGREFREDYGLGLNDPDLWGEDEDGKPPVVILDYKGECQSCGLRIEIHERFPVPGMPEPEVNKPTGFVARKPWSIIPAGWFVRAKVDGPWYEVLRTRAMHSDLQLVTIRMPDGREHETQRPKDDQVQCRRGSLAPSSVQAALDTLSQKFETSIIEDQVD